MTKPATPSRSPTLLWQIALVLLGGIAVFHPLDALVRRLVSHETVATILSVGIAAGAMASVLYYLFVRRLRRLNVVLAQFGAGELDRELPARAGGEIGTLVENVELMVGRLRNNYEELKKNDDLRRQLVANVSHELRTPLTNIQGYLETASASTGGNAELEKNLAICLRESRKLARLVKDLFELSKLDTQQIDFHFETISLVELADQVGAAFEQRMADKELVFEVQLPDDPLEIIGDGNRLSQVVANLLGNAAVFTRPGGRIILSCERAEGRARLSVADTGIGIPASELPHIFESFFHLEKSRTRNLGGTGLGLAISKAIVEAHDGSIGVTSQTGEGTTFTVELGLAPELGARSG